MRPLKKISSDGTRRRMIRDVRIFVIIVVGCMLTTSLINTLYHRKLAIGTGSARQTVTDGFKNDIADTFGITDAWRSKHNVVHIKGRFNPHYVDQSNVKSSSLKSDTTTNRHTLAGLSCEKYGGPSDEAAAEMVYWSDIPTDSSYVSPFKKKTTAVQYMTFEPDEGGWNNIRMSMETIVVAAHAMGRTLVLPPNQGIYLLQQDKGKQKTSFSFADFFHLNSIDLEHAGIDIITTEEFLLREAMTGNLKNTESNLISFPPHNITNWDGEKSKEIRQWLRTVTLVPTWDFTQCIAAFPASTNSGNANRLNIMLELIDKKEDQGPEKTPEFLEKPTPVDAAPIDRMTEMRRNRKRKLCIYDEEMQNAPVLHFSAQYRLLTHFYAFLFFEDWKQQLWTNRFIRDHLRYIDELQCAAARVVEALREKAKKNGSPEGIFDTLHVRRGDFQYKDTRVDATVLYDNSADLIPENTTLFIATDERNKTYFGPFKDHYHIYFLDDFKDVFEDLNTNYYGMLDQLIASKGRTFFGTYYSTFTGYINRMRGYRSQKYKDKGHDIGAIESYFLIPKHVKNAMRKYTPLTSPMWAREFPVSWRDIDKGIGKLS